MENQESELIELKALSQEEANPGATVRRKRAYEKPAFLYRAPLEAMASVCATFPGKGPGHCGTLFS